jgi:paraquat-inducible protein B
MAERLTAPADAPALAEPEVRRRRGISPIWAVPIVAIIVAGWLGYTAFTEKGPAISISFGTASGIEAGKTRVKHHDIELGVVERVEPSPDLSQVFVRARMNKMAAAHLKEGTNFWVVRPRISLSGLSGLDTLVSGAYIEMDPGQGAPAHSFNGLEVPPVVRSDEPGTQFVLTTHKLGSVSAGSPIYFRGIKVGEVIRYAFLGAEEGVSLPVFVRQPYDRLINDGTRFWNASGVTLSAGGEGFKVEVESLEAVLAGGIAFETFGSNRAAQPSKEGSTFPLYDGHDEAQDASFTRLLRVIVEFKGSVHGLAVGAPVEFRGMKIGRVVEFHLEFDPASGTYTVPVTLAIEIERMRLTEGSYDQYGKGALLPEFVKRGLRAQLRTANLITGQLIVAFDIFPDAEPATIVQTGTYPKLPTMPNELESMTHSVSETLDKIAALPLDQVVQDVQGILGAVLVTVNSPDLKDSLKSLSQALAGADRLLRDANGQMGPLAASIRRVSDTADTALKQVDATLSSATAGYGGDSTMRVELSNLLRQFQEAARSVRQLASYLEQHPEALLRGKPGGPP